MLQLWTMIQVTQLVWRHAHDAPAALLVTLIVKEESSQKRHQLGRVLQGFLKEERVVVSSLRKEDELLHEGRKLKRRRRPLAKLPRILWGRRRVRHR